MKRLFIYVEGLTEEVFVERLLRSHLGHHGVKVERPLQAKKDFDPDGPRGGFTNWPAMEADMRDWFADHPDAESDECRFTTLLDLYALPSEVPGYPGRAVAATESDVAAIESAIAQELGEPRFTPYLQRHEFEALLLAHPPALATIFPESANAIQTLADDINGQNPEDINHGKTTHPAARIRDAIPDYYELKASNAYWVAAEIGIDSLASTCSERPSQPWLFSPSNHCSKTWGSSVSKEFTGPSLAGKAAPVPGQLKRHGSAPSVPNAANKRFHFSSNNGVESARRKRDAYSTAAPTASFLKL